ncbi:MAG: prepilin-type N-terminal cleavage/methylation domain-containing protein [Kiritimatiellae bacterium]|nr:prepilin-type N-terminal cleavage/methylation domain-containing protein [Kiritimatiellia bacterium]
MVSHRTQGVRTRTTQRRRGERRRPGFTLPEVLIALGLLTLVSAAVWSVYVFCQRIYGTQTVDIYATRDASMCLFNMVYGRGKQAGLRACVSATLVSEDEISFVRPDGSAGRFLHKDRRIVDEAGRVLCDDVEDFSISRTGSVLLLTLKKIDQEGMFTSTNDLNTVVYLRNMKWE